MGACSTLPPVEYFFKLDDHLPVYELRLEVGSCPYWEPRVELTYSLTNGNTRTPDAPPIFVPEPGAEGLVLGAMLLAALVKRRPPRASLREDGSSR